MDINFGNVTDFLNKTEDVFHIPACECMVFQNHNCLYHYHTGHLDFEKKEKIRGGEWYWIYSCTKLLTITAALQLWEQGRIDLDDPVEKYLPEFGSMQVKNADGLYPAKNAMTLRQLMTMTAGLNYDLNIPSILRIKEETQNKASTRQVIQALASAPLDFEPGSHFCYSLCHDVLGTVVEVASDMPLSMYIQKHVAEPLGIKGMTFHPTEKEFSHMPVQLCFDDNKKMLCKADKENGFKLSEKYESGGAGVCCRVEDYILFADALACGGIGKTGNRILKEETIRYMASNHLSGEPLADFHRTMKPEIEGYGLGVRVYIKGDSVHPAGEFGWDGAAGATVMIEPENQLSVFYVQHVCNYLPSYAQLHPELLRRIYAAIRNEEI